MKPFLVEALNPTFDYKNMTIAKLASLITTSTYFNVDTEMMFDHFCWIVGKCKSSIEKWFISTGYIAYHTYGTANKIRDITYNGKYHKPSFNEVQTYEVKPDLDRETYEALGACLMKRQFRSENKKVVAATSHSLGFRHENLLTVIDAAYWGNHHLLKRLVINHHHKMGPGIWMNMNSLQCAQFARERNVPLHSERRYQFNNTAKFSTIDEPTETFLLSLGMEMDSWTSRQMCVNLKHMPAFERLQESYPFELGDNGCGHHKYENGPYNYNEMNDIFINYLLDNGHFTWSGELYKNLLEIMDVENFDKIFTAMPEGFDTSSIPVIVDMDKMRYLYGKGFRYSREHLLSYIFSLSIENLLFLSENGHEFDVEYTKKAFSGYQSYIPLFTFFNNESPLPLDYFVKNLTSAGVYSDDCIKIAHLGGYQYAQKGSIPILRISSKQMFKYIHMNIDPDYIPLPGNDVYA